MKIFSVLFIILVTLLLILFGSFFIDTNKSSSLITHIKEDSTIHLKFGHNTPVNSALHEAALKFAAEVQRKTNNEVVIDVFPAQKLGNDHQMVEMARNGELDIILTPTAKMSVAVPSMQYADLPFYFPTREDVYEMLDGEPGQIVLQDLKAIGLIGVSFWENGFKHFTANQPILTIEDFKNKKFRVMKSRIIMDQFKDLGAEPVLIDFYSTKQALHDGVVDGQENPLVAIVSMEFYKEQSDLTLSEHAYLGYVLSFSEKTFNQLPQDTQMILIDTAKEITPWEREETHKREEKLLETIKNAGVNIHKISEQERQRFAEKTSHIPAAYEDIIGADILSKTKELLYKKYGSQFSNKDHILIGIDADISSDSKVAGLAIKRGAELAVAEINKKGGLLGKSLEVIVKDHRAITSKGVQNIREFAENKNLVAIIGGVHGPVISAEINTIQELKIPYLIPWAATSGLVENGFTDNYIFRVSANDNLVAKFLAAYTLKKHKRPAIVAVNSVWGRNNLKLIEQYLQSHNITGTTKVVFNRGQQKFEKEISKIINSKADSLIMIANPWEASGLLQELYKKKKTLPIISHWGITSGKFFQENEALLKELDLSIFQTFSFNKALNPKAQHLLNSYKKQYLSNKNADIPSSAGVVQAYDIVNLLALAIKKAGTTDKVKVKEALENLPNYQGVIKDYKPAFTKKNHDALDDSNYYMAKYNSNGILVPIKNK